MVMAADSCWRSDEGSGALDPSDLSVAPYFDVYCADGTEYSAAPLTHM